MRHILTEISPKFKLRIKYVLKRFVKRAPGLIFTTTFIKNLNFLFVTIVCPDAFLTSSIKNIQTYSVSIFNSFFSKLHFYYYYYN